MTKLINEKAVSEVVGVVLLVSVAVLGVAIVAVTFFSQPAPSEIPHLSVVAGATEDNTTFVLVHEGGDALKKGNYRIYVDSEGGLKDRTDEFDLAGDDDVWSIGEKLSYTGTPGRVVISVVDSGGAETLIAEPAYAGVVDTGGYVDAGGAGVVPVVPPAPGDSPVTIVSPSEGENLVFSGDTNDNHKVATMEATVTAPGVEWVDFMLYCSDTPGLSNQKDVRLMRKITTENGHYTWSDIKMKDGGLVDLTTINTVTMVAIAYDSSGGVIGVQARVVTVVKA